MNLLQLLVCAFALLGVNNFVSADMNCTWHLSHYVNVKAFFKYRCHYVCDEENNKIDKSFTRFDIGYESSFVDEMTFENCLFDDESSWEGTWNLRCLNVSNSQLSRIPTKILSGNVAIQEMDFSNNFIESVDPSTFKGVQNISRVDLSHNNIMKLHENAFDPLTVLRDLDLSFNPIESLKIETFAYLQQLEYLSLKHTNLSSIQLGIFLYQHKLIALDLSGSNLKYLDFKLYLPVFYDLRILVLSDNQLTDLTGFRNEIFPQLTLLDIRGNQFMCSYLQGFFESINFNWSKIRLANNPQLTKEHKPNIRGVDCKKSSNVDTSLTNNVIANNTAL